MNLYYAPDTYIEPNGFQWVPQEIIAMNEEEARKILPKGKYRLIKLVATDIDTPDMTVEKK